MARLVPHALRAGCGAFLPPTLRIGPVASAIWLLVGCHSVPPGRLAVDSIRIEGAAELGDGEIKERIATSESPRFLGIWNGVAFEYTFVDRFVLQQDLARIERLYRARGHYNATVRAARIVEDDPGHGRVEIVVDEGPAVQVERVELLGLEAVPFQAQAAIVEALDHGLGVGDRFDEEEYERTKRSMRKALLDRGYGWARVRGKVVVNLLTNKASIRFWVGAGPILRVGSVAIQGLGRSGIPEDRVRDTFSVARGSVLSVSELEAGEIALRDLGVFADVSVSYTPDPRSEESEPAEPTQRSSSDEGGSRTVDVLVVVTPAPLRVVKLGVGGEFDVIRSDLHAVAGWESRNFLGGLRRFSITAKPGVVLFPTRVDNLQAPDRLLPEGRLSAELRQPGFLEARTGGIVRSELAAYPVLLRSAGGLGKRARVIENVILGYREIKGAVGLDRSFFRNHLYLGTFVHGQAYYPFPYVGVLDSELKDVQIRYVELVTQVSFRDSAVRPHSGVLLGNTFQVAGGPLQGSVEDLKLQPELRVYVPISRTVTFAVRGALGFLFPRNYGQSLLHQEQATVADQQLLYFRALFSGGPGSNRGYPYRGVGPHGPALFLAPNLSAQQLRDECNPTSPAFGGFDPQVCRVPLGGLTLWEASSEVRFPILGPLTGALFADTSDVTRAQTTFHFEYLHLSAGSGLRYDTPVGPIRLDVGYRVPGLQKLGGELEDDQGDPGNILGAPIAFSIAVGEAF